MKILLTFLQSANVEVIVAALKVLQRVMQSAEMKEYWVKFLELILIKVIDCYKNGKEVRVDKKSIQHTNDIHSLSPQQVSREIDAIILCVAEHLPLDATINILKPIISTGAFPTNLCALKILKELTEWQGQQISEKQLDSIMEQITKVGRSGRRPDVLGIPILRFCRFSARTTPNRWCAKRPSSVSSHCTWCWARSACDRNSVC